MLIQSIQKKRALCKLISATFLANSVGLPTTFAAEAVSVENTATGTASKADTKTDTVKTRAATAETKTDTTADASKADTKADASKTDTKADASKAETKTDAKASTEKKSGIGAMKDPSWAFKEDGKTPLTADELKARNYKNYYSNDEIKQIQEYLNWYGYDWLINHGYNLSVSKRASDGSSYIVIPHQEVQANSTTDNSGTSEADSKTAVSCGSGYEMVNGSCVVKCAAYETRNAETKLCETKTCDGGKVLNQKTGICEAPVCPTELTYVEGKGCQGSGDVFSCPEGTDFDNDKKACIASCAEGTTRDKDGICKAAKKDETASSTCQLAYQEWNATDKKCEDKVCAAGQVLDKDSGKCIDKVTCPVGQVKNDNGVCAANDCTKEGKVTWTQSDGTQVCKDKCSTGQVRNKNTGECDTLGKTQITSCPSNTIKNTAEAKCDVCPDGQKPNDDQTACVDDGTKKSNDGGSKGSSKSKLAKLGGLAALAGIFLASKHHKDDGGAPGQKSNNSEDKNGGKGKGALSKNYSYKKDIPDIDIKLEDENGTATSSFYPGQAPYYATIKVGKLKDADEKISSMAVSIAAKPGQGFSYSSMSYKFENGRKFQLIKDQQPLPSAGRYYIYIHIKSTDKDGNLSLRTARAEVDVIEGAGTLSTADGHDFNAKTNLVAVEPSEESEYKYGLSEAKIVSATWQNGTCQLVVDGGTIVGEGQTDTLGSSVPVNSSSIGEKACTTENLKDKMASFSSLSVDSDSRAFSDEGKVEIPGVTDGVDIESLDENSKHEYLDALHRQAVENDVQFYNDMPFGRKDGKWVDYSGAPLTEDAVKKYHLDEEYTVVHNEDGSDSLVDKDGKAYYMDQKTYGETLMNSRKNGDVASDVDENGKVKDGEGFSVSTFLKDQMSKITDHQNNGITKDFFDQMFPDVSAISEATLGDEIGDTLKKTGKDLINTAKELSATASAPAKKKGQSWSPWKGGEHQSKDSDKHEETSSGSSGVNSGTTGEAPTESFAKVRESATPQEAEAASNNWEVEKTVEIPESNAATPTQKRYFEERAAKVTAAKLCGEITIGEGQDCNVSYSYDKETRTLKAYAKAVSKINQ